LQQNLQQVAPNQEKPHTTPLHSLIYSIYISVIRTQRAAVASRRTAKLATHLLGSYYLLVLYLSGLEGSHVA
jgi:hypothetical protein